MDDSCPIGYNIYIMSTGVNAISSAQAEDLGKWLKEVSHEQRMQHGPQMQFTLPQDISILVNLYFRRERESLTGAMKRMSNSVIDRSFSAIQKRYWKHLNLLTEEDIGTIIKHILQAPGKELTYLLHNQKLSIVSKAPKGAHKKKPLNLQQLQDKDKDRNIEVQGSLGNQQPEFITEEDTKKILLQIIGQVGNYLKNFQLKDQKLHENFQRYISQYVFLRFSPEPKDEIGTILFKQGSFLVALVKLITRSSPSPFITNYMYEFLNNGYGKILITNMNIFKRECQKAQAEYQEVLQRKYDDILANKMQKDNDKGLIRQPIKRRCISHTVSLTIRGLGGYNQQMDSQGQPQRPQSHQTCVRASLKQAQSEKNGKNQEERPNDSSSMNPKPQNQVNGNDEEKQQKENPQMHVSLQSSFASPQKATNITEEFVLTPQFGGGSVDPKIDSKKKLKNWSKLQDDAIVNFYTSRAQSNQIRYIILENDRRIVLQRIGELGLNADSYLKNIMRVVERNMHRSGTKMQKEGAL